jgi:hypothetical protein
VRLGGPRGVGEDDDTSAQERFVERIDVTLALSASEDPGWVAQVCGTSERRMIFEHYAVGCPAWTADTGGGSPGFSAAESVREVSAGDARDGESRVLFLWSTVVFPVLGVLVGRLFGGTLNMHKAATVILASGVPNLALYFFDWLVPSDALFEALGREASSPREVAPLALWFLLTLAYIVWYQSGVYAEALPIRRGRAIIATVVGCMILAVGAPMTVLFFEHP